MDNLIVKPVDVIGDTIMAAKDNQDVIWVGINSFCQGLDMEKKQRDWQVEKIKQDKTLLKGCRLLPAGVFDASNEVYALRLDFVPIWLAKISITKRMEQEHPELADKLLEYQLKAKDILAAAFLPNQSKIPQNPMELLELHYEAIKYVDKKVNTLTERVNKMEYELPVLPVEAEAISAKVKRRGVECLGGKKSIAYRNRELRQRLYWDLHVQLRREFQVSTYKAIKRNQVEQAISFIESYEPPLVMKQEISKINLQEVSA